MGNDQGLSANSGVDMAEKGADSICLTIRLLTDSQVEQEQPVCLTFSSITRENSTFWAIGAVPPQPQVTLRTKLLLLLLLFEVEIWTICVLLFSFFFLGSPPRM